MAEKSRVSASEVEWMTTVLVRGIMKSVNLFLAEHHVICIIRFFSTIMLKSKR